MSVLARRLLATFAATAGALALATTTAGAGVVGPAELSYDARPGETIPVTTPQLPPTPDVVLLVDRTGSMGSAIDNVKANMAGVIATVRPSGTTSTPTSDGYYRMVATDEVDPAVRIYVRDTASNQQFGPYTSGTTFKVTQAPGGKVEVKPFTGEVQNRFTLNGDAELIGRDSSGNVGTTVCTVAPR